MFSTLPIIAQDTPPDVVPVDTVQTDTIPEETLTAPADTIPSGPYQPTNRPQYGLPDRYGDPLSNRVPRSPLYLQAPTQLDFGIEIDSSINYSIYERVNGLDYRAPSYLNFDQYQQIQDQRILRDYWRNRSAALDGESAVSGRRLIPPIYTTPAFDRLFGGSYVDIRPNGFVTLDFGGRFQRIFNPNIPIRQQRNGNFEFDQQISLNVVGTIGDKLQITANFDNNNSFDFQNNVKVEYTGYDHEIIKKIELGVVSMPVSNSLITGSQSLFGIKTQLQFGRLFVTSVASVQRGSSDAITIESGTQTRDFEIIASEYDENRHFFLNHYFRSNYENWLRSLPQIYSGLNLTRVEVYVLNRNNDTETLRGMATFMDLGEGSVIFRDDNPQIGEGQGGPARNGANQLYSNLLSSNQLRDVNQTSTILESDFNLVKATDFEVITSARKLTEREFTFDSQLGYISLNRRLQNDEVLAVAYEYTLDGQRYQVGELTEDYQNLPEDQVIFLKMLRPTKINTEVPTWDLMMKNIYTLNASQISREGFQLRVVYRDDRTGIDNPSLHEGENTRDVQLVNLFNLDNLNQNNDPQEGGDGNFDFIEGITINPDQGFVVFPVLEPFGSHLEEKFAPGEDNLVDRYVYNSLYNTTKADAELNTNKNKFFIVGSFVSGSANEIMLPGINIAEGSVQVIAGNTPLSEGVDFTVDYNLGRVTILNEGILNSGKRIQIQYEKADLFNFQQRSLFGTRLEYRINDDINIGGTILHLNERPIISRVSIGDEPTKNTKYGFDINYRKDSRFITKLVDALPLIQTKEPSTVTFNAEFAQLIPGTSNVVDGDGTSYIDDFENTVTPFSLNGWQNWVLASTPTTDDQAFVDPNAGPIGRNYRRAKLAWYVVDNTAFYTSRGGLVSGIPLADDILNHYERGILPREVFPFQDEQVLNFYLPVFDLAYFPEERGPYNYNPNLTDEGLLSNPEDNWGGITRAITSDVDFDKTNIEYLEFWMLDPFIGGENGTVIDGRVNQPNTTGGKLIFNLGSISEDVIPDDRHFFENGLPEDYTSEDVNVTDVGRTPDNQFLIDNFSNGSQEVRRNQDVGFEGVRNDDEANFFAEAFMNRLSPAARQAVASDPSADNFQYYLGDSLDNNEIRIIERYKNFNNQEGNTPITSGNNNDRFTPSGSQFPDNEDLNRDNTLSDLEEYYEYEVDLRPGQLQVGQNNIVDAVTSPTAAGENVTWYQFRIPIRQPDRRQGSIQGFKSIRYVRTLLTGFSQPVVMRFARFQLVGSQWRRYLEDLSEKQLGEYPENYDPEFFISAVNIEENGAPTDEGSAYTLPPGFRRDRDNTSPVERRVNEQSLQLCIDDLRDGDARAAYKNMTLDLINYGSIRMFFHAESQTAQDSSVTGFLRLGTDFDQNYYEIEVPLVMSPDGSGGEGEERLVWPEENEIDIALDELSSVKSARNQSNVPITLPFSRQRGKYKITVVGRPELSTVQTLMVGIRNPISDDRAPQSLCVWANELRVGDFDRTSGWAANARINTKLADFANVTASVRHSTFGFGGIQSRISERTREEATEYDVSVNANLDKFFPQRFGLQIPVFASYERATIVPQFDPKDPDIPLDAALSARTDPRDRANYLDIVTDQSTRRSLNFTNVRKNKVGENTRNHFFDVSNFTFSYSYSDQVRSNFNTATYEQRLVRGGLGYNYSFPELNIQPFANVGFLQSPWFALIRDFNFSPVPSSLSFRGDLQRNFVKTQYRDENLFRLDPLYEKAFTFNRIYDLQWNLTQSLALDYSARTFAIIDEPDGELDTEAKRDEVMQNLRNFGRMKNYTQAITATYAVPLDKIPITDWISADARYQSGYTWQAGPYDPTTVTNTFEDIGNNIQNNRDRSATGKIDMVGLYNKIKFLKEVNDGGRGRRPQPQPPRNPQDTTQQEKPKPDLKALKGLSRLIMALRSINVTYSLNEGTMLPGFIQTPYLFGLDDAFAAPGIPFLLGSQDPSIRFEAARQGWLSPSQLLTMPFQQSQVENINVRADIEPFRDFRVQVDFSKAVTNTYQEIFRQDSLGSFSSLPPVRSGNYNISYLTIQTAFSQDTDQNISEIFNQFVQNREAIQRRLTEENPNQNAIYNINSQDVLIPAFLAAYSDQDAEQVRLSPFPRIPLPNWRVDYAGLPRLFSGLGEAFAQFTINHAYQSAYSVNNFTTSAEYDLTEAPVELNSRVENYDPTQLSEIKSIQDENGESINVFVPLYVVQQVTITERFAPLIGVNIRTKGRLTSRISYDRERSLSLNLSNAQVTELRSQAITFTFGFTKDKFKLPFRVQGRTVTLENDITFNLAMSFKDTKTVQRKIDNDNTITNGNVNFQARPTLDYRVNERLNIQLYFNRTINNPLVTSSFRRTTTEFGTQIRFNLAQ